MSFREIGQSWLRRVDVRVGMNLAVLFAPLVAVVLFVLYLFVADEFLELATFELDERLRQLESVWDESDAGLRNAKLALLGEQLALDDGGFRIADAGGRVLLAGGSTPRRTLRADTGHDFLRSIRLRADDERRGLGFRGHGLCGAMTARRRGRQGSPTRTDNAPRSGGCAGLGRSGRPGPSPASTAG